MQLSLTVILCLATGVVSWQALSNTALFSKLSLSPYRVKHNKEIYAGPITHIPKAIQKELQMKMHKYFTRSFFL